jgi:hypothetical protein
VASSFYLAIENPKLQEVGKEVQGKLKKVIEND